MSERDEPKPASDRSLLDSYRAGSDRAAGEIYSRYARRLAGLVRAQRSSDLARRVEVEEIVQSVFGSFFRAAGQGFYDLPEGGELWNLFLVIALNKIRAKGNYHRAAKRDVRRVEPGAPHEHTLEAVADHDSAAESVLRVAIDDALSRLPPRHRDAIQLRIEGYEVGEIASRLGSSMRTTERLLQEARQLLAGLLQPDDNG